VCFYSLTTSLFCNYAQLLLWSIYVQFNFAAPPYLSIVMTPCSIEANDGREVVLGPRTPPPPQARSRYCRFPSTLFFMSSSSPRTPHSSCFLARFLLRRLSCAAAQFLSAVRMLCTLAFSNILIGWSRQLLRDVRTCDCKTNDPQKCHPTYTFSECWYGFISGGPSFKFIKQRSAGKPGVFKLAVVSNPS
jgi:hypothetical protein